jgi:hypothetical protein
VTSTAPLQFLILLVGSWISRRQGEAIEFLQAENRVLRARLGPRRLRFTHAERRLLAEKGKPLGRKLLAEVASLATPETILRRYCVRRPIVIAWLSTQIDIRAVADEFNAYTVTQIRIALGQVAKHPLRGPETSYDAVTDHGKVSAGQPVAGVRLRRDGDAYVFRLTEVSGEVYSWDELTMKTTSFPGFVHAMRDLLRAGKRPAG